ncbi:MAG: hypothetical protein DKT66_10400 [Candidatus Melainabacteria bacterium]|nr:MAG: hypothetical protein DKT66_10400 [Candidatus Melainabacteria bacterium]
MGVFNNKVAFLGVLAGFALSGAALQAKTAPVSSAPSAPTAATSKTKTDSASTTAAGSFGYRVEATSNYAGTLSCQMCKEGIRVKSDRMGLTWILTAPKWNAQIYNTSTECYMDLPYNEWTKRQSFMPMAKKRTTLKLEKTNNTKVMHGLNTRQYLIMATFPAGAPGMPGGAGMSGIQGMPGAPGSTAKATKVAAKTAAMKPVTVREAEMWVAKDPCVPRQFNELMGKIFGIPAEDGLPLSISLRQKNGKITSIWETVKLTKSNITKDEFKPIAGYKKVKTEVEMMLGDQDLGLSESDGLDSKPVKRPKMDEMP